ncbi:MAG: YqaJ viral recombinase family protein [Candidatus Cloacimonetes bacterium]|nr:YqaJ viral recombinase family protein [Candidatus Cloacimonadota bacterium]
MVFDGRCGIIDIDDDEKTVYFDTYRTKKITGTKIGPLLGISEFSTPFKVACELAGLYPGDKANKYIDAGNILEPVLRKYVRDRSDELLLGLFPKGSVITIEEPVPKEQCGYDHFHDNKMFGGMVDGYIDVNGKRDHILEIKTSHDIEKWIDDSGRVSIVPESYMLQASLYAELSGIDRIIFLVGFLEESDYVHPERWVPTSENTYIVIKDKLDMSGYMKEAEEWYSEYIKNGYTPEWTDKDTDVLKYLKAFDPNKKKRH